MGPRDQGFNDALWERVRSSDLKTRADFLFELGERASSAEHWTEARNFHGKALELYRTLGRDSDFAKASYAIGFCYFQLGDTEDALHHLNLALEFGEYLNQISLIAFSAALLAGLLSEMQKYDDASQKYQLAVEKFLDSDEYFQAGCNCILLGEVYKKTGQQSMALYTFMRAHNIFQGLRDANGSAKALERMASAHVDLGHFEKAIFELEDALRIFEFIEQPERAAHIKYRLGWTLNLANRHVEAEPLLRQAMHFYRMEKLWLKAAIVELQLYESLMLRNPMVCDPEATLNLPTVKSFFLSLNASSHVITCDSLVAEWLTLRGDYQTAVLAWQGVLMDSISVSNEYFVRMARLNVAESLCLLGKQNDAAKELGLLSFDWGEDKINSERHQALIQKLSP